MRYDADGGYISLSCLLPMMVELSCQSLRCAPTYIFSRFANLRIELRECNATTTIPTVAEITLKALGISSANSESSLPRKSLPYVRQMDFRKITKKQQQPWYRQQKPKKNRKTAAQAPGPNPQSTSRRERGPCQREESIRDQQTCMCTICAKIHGNRRISERELSNMSLDTREYLAGGSDAIPLVQASV